MPRDEVGMEVREDDMGDAQAMLLGERQVLLNVALRIDHRGDAGGLVADQIRRVREAIQIKLVEDHALEFAQLWPSIHAENFLDSAPPSPVHSLWADARLQPSRSRRSRSRYRRSRRPFLPRNPISSSSMRAC